MAVTFRSANAITQNTTSPYTSCVVNKPIGVIDGDFLVVALYFYHGGVADASFTITPPSGWTQITRVAGSFGGATEGTLVTYRKFASSEPSTWTWTCSSSENNPISAVSLAYTGVNTTNPINVSASASTGTNGTSQTAGSVTTTTNNCVILNILGAINGTASGATWTPATGTTERAECTSASTLMTTESADFSLASAGASGTKTYTISQAVTNAGECLYATLAIAPINQYSQSVTGTSGVMSGTVTKVFTRFGVNLTGTITSSASLAKNIAKFFTGSAGTVSGTIGLVSVKIVNLVGVTGSISATLAKQFTRYGVNIAGNISSSAALTTAARYVRSLTGTLSMTGSMGIFSTVRNAIMKAGSVVRTFMRGGNA